MSGRLPYVDPAACTCPVCADAEAPNDAPCRSSTAGSVYDVVGRVAWVVVFVPIAMVGEAWRGLGRRLRS